MSATKPADITLDLQKDKKVFTAILDQPTDTDIIDIWKLLLPVLMKTKYDEHTLIYNLSGVIIPPERYEHIYSKGAYSIPPVISQYDDTIDRDATRTEFYQDKRQHEAGINDPALYETTYTSCKNFII